MPQYDYIIIGAGAAGLSLLCRIIKSEELSQKKILLIDRGPKNMNDRTWCFWEKEKGFFEEIVYRKWDQLEFKSEKYSGRLEVGDYQYKMIRGIDFYNWCFDEISKHSSIDIQYGDVKFDNPDAKGRSKIFVNDQEISVGNAIVFNSISSGGTDQKNTIRLLQHFKGWLIEADTDQFNPQVATLMDFRVHQRYGTSFVYVLPLSARQALVEYTLFTGSLLEPEAYNKALENYIHEFLGITNFSTREEEFGVIPMTNARFAFFENGVYNIGSAGGQTKASTGYTFQFIQKQVQRIVTSLEKNQSLQDIPRDSARFRFYDSVLLRLLSENKLEGRDIFSRLFERNQAENIFKFLDNETSLNEELSIISSLQTLPFLKAAIQQL